MKDQDFWLNFLDELYRNGYKNTLIEALRAIPLDALFAALDEYNQALAEFDEARKDPPASDLPYKQVSFRFAIAIDRRLKAQAKVMKFLKDVMRKVRT